MESERTSSSTRRPHYFSISFAGDFDEKQTRQQHQAPMSAQESKLEVGESQAGRWHPAPAHR